MSFVYLQMILGVGGLITSSRFGTFTFLSLGAFITFSLKGVANDTKPRSMALRVSLMGVNGFLLTSVTDGLLHRVSLLSGLRYE